MAAPPPKEKTLRVRPPAGAVLGGRAHGHKNAIFGGSMTAAQAPPGSESRGGDDDYDIL